MAKKPKASSQRISEKIPVLMAEGKTQKQAVGEAYGMERAGRLRRHGVYVRASKRRTPTEPAR